MPPVREAATRGEPPERPPAPVRTVLPLAARALALADQLATRAADAKYRGDLLRDVLGGRLRDPARQLPPDHGLGPRPGRALLVVVAETDPVSGAVGPVRDLRRIQDGLTAAWTAAVTARDPRATVVGYPHEVVVLLDAPPDGTAAGLAREAARRATGAWTVAGRTFSTGISRPCHGVAGLAGAYEQARRALGAGRRLHGAGAVADFDQLGVFRLLSLIPDPAELERFAREALGPLADTRDTEAEDLRRTLQALLDTNLNVAETSRRLYLHYNTLRYRIGKLERLLGPFTQDPELRLNLSIALQIVRMQGQPPQPRRGG